jgi:hypothetical protein
MKKEEETIIRNNDHFNPATLTSVKSPSIKHFYMRGGVGLKEV